MKIKQLALAVACALAAPLKRIFENGIPKYHIQPFAKYALLTTNSAVALGQAPMPNPKGSDLVSVRLEHNLVANPGANDTAWLCDLPEDCVPVDCILDSDDLDAGATPTITISVGFLNAAKTALDGTAWIAASTIGQTGGMARPTTNTMVKTAPSSARKPVGLLFPAVAATFATGKIGLTLVYRSAHFGK